MKEFKTISEYEILKLAYYSLLEKFSIEEKIYNKDNRKVISVNRMKKYNEQLEELHSRIIEIENSKNS